MTFFEKLDTSVQKNNSLLCVGLDTDVHRIPHFLVEESDEYIFEFNKAIIDATANLVCAFKPNIAFYEADGIEGLAGLEKTIEYIHATYPEIPVILDAKRADIGNTSAHYAMAIFDQLKADAVTVNPYMGFDSLEQFLSYKDKGIIILCRTSNKGAKDFQDLVVEGEPLYVKVAKKIVEWNDTYNNCLMVVGATWPEQLGKIRELAPEMTFLIPGIGSQGGDLEGTLKNGLKKDKTGLIINASRSIIYASDEDDFALKAQDEALKLRDQINQYRK
jgi:orotidine-5'-phosphate decarboxylase